MYVVGDGGMGQEPDPGRLAGTWNKARAEGVPDDVIARIGRRLDESWSFDADLDGKGGSISSFVDTCP